MKLLPKLLPQVKGQRSLTWQLYVVFALVLVPLLGAFSFAVLPTPNAHAARITLGPYPIDVNAGSTNGGTTANITYTIYQPGDAVPGNSTTSPNICPKAQGNGGTEPPNTWCYTFIVANVTGGADPINNFESGLGRGVTIYDVGFDNKDTDPNHFQPSQPATISGAGTPPVIISQSANTLYQFSNGTTGSIPVGKQSVQLYFEANKPPGPGNGTFSINGGTSGNNILPGFSPLVSQIAAQTVPDPTTRPTIIGANGEKALTIGQSGIYKYTIFFTNPATDGNGNPNTTTLQGVQVSNKLPSVISADTTSPADYTGTTATNQSGTETIGVPTQSFKTYDVAPGQQIVITFNVQATSPLVVGTVYYIKPTSTFTSTTDTASGSFSLPVQGGGVLYAGPQAYDEPITTPPNPTGGCDPTTTQVTNACQNLSAGYNFIGATAAPVTVAPNGVVTGLQTNLSSLSLQANAGATTSVQNSLTLSSGQKSTNWTSSISYDAGASGWLSLSPASGLLASFNSTTLSINANPTGLAAGTYTAYITFADANAASDNVRVATSLTVGNGGAYSYYLPSLANAASGYTSSIIVQNLGSAAATLSSQYYDTAGNSIGTQSVSTSVAPNASYTLANALANGAHGTGYLTSNQPLSVLVQESTPFGSSAYAVGAGAASTLVAPLAINNNGGFATQLTVANGAAVATTAQVKFYDQSGSLVAGATRTLNLAAHGSQTLDQTAADSGLASGYYGWAKIEGAAGSQLTAQVLEQRADIKFVALANAQVVSASSSVYAPAIFRGAFNGFVTGANIVNPNGSPVQVSITYYSSTGQAYAAAPFTLAAYGVAAVYQGASSGNGIPAGGLPDGFYGSATVSTSGGSVAMVVNEAGSQTQNGAAQSGTYAAATSGASSLGLAVMANGSNGYVTGATILNTSNGAVSGNLTYYNQSGATVATQAFTIAAHASLPVYQGAGNLPAGYSGSAVVSQANGTAGSLLATTNAQSPDLFYTYTSN